jgi:hypothetical protein
VEDDEAVVRFVPRRDWIVRSGTGRAELTVAAFPEQELEGRKGKSVSVLRSITEPGELARRAVGRNREPAWDSDPVIARGLVGPMRQLRDHAERREVCVNADPITDDFGICPTHASILRSDPPPDRSQRLQRAKLRLALTTSFADVSHLSGRAITDRDV